MNLTIIGTGYVGTVAAACFADKGNDVVCVDIDADKIEKLNRGISPIYEPGLSELILKNKERLAFTTSIQDGVKHAQVIFLAVGTPQKKNSFEADLQYIEAAAITIAKLMAEPKTIVIKSTVPLGTSTHLGALMRAHTRHAVTIVSNPEFLKEGDAVRDFESPDRIIIGTDDERARETMTELYAPFFRKTDRLLFMSNASAELAKYAGNIMLASRISVMNELARVAEAAGADILDVRQAVGSDSRIGQAFLFPGAGYGGSCFPKDVREMIALAERHNIHLSLIPAINTTNEDQKKYFSNKVHRTLGNVQGKNVAVWGIAFKAKTDDIRKSAAKIVIQDLIDGGANVTLYDPEAMENAKKRYGDAIQYAGQYECLENADALIIMTDWNEFKNPDFNRMKTALRQPVIIDSRNLYSLARMEDEGFVYTGIGRDMRQVTQLRMPERTAAYA
jgi:UDPglucose 6-dehydrogenase